MIWIIVIIVIVFIIGKFIGSLDADKKELNKEPLEQKFKILVGQINNRLYNNKGKVTVIDNRSFNLYEEGTNQIVQFFYSSGNLSLTWRWKRLVNETICNKNFSNVRDAGEQKQQQIFQTFVQAIAYEIEKRENLDKMFFPEPPTVKVPSLESTKFRINSLFYEYCFAPETAKIFLEENDMRLNITKAINMSIFEKEKTLESTFKIFLKKKYAIELGENSYSHYRYNGFRFFLDVQRFYIEDSDENTFFEMLYNDFEGVKNEDGDEALIAKEFIVYVKDFFPVAIFVFVYDPNLETYAFRRVFGNGISSNIGFIEDDEGTEAMDFLKEYVAKNNF